MLEVQGYVKRIPKAQVRFREDPDAMGNAQETLERILEAFRSLGVEINEADREALEERLR
jgi:hypothetical protein